MIDFRNEKPEKILNIFKKNKFNEFKINNFFKIFNNQNFDKINSIKGIKNIADLSRLIPQKTLILVKNIKDNRNNEKFIFKTIDDYYIESVLMPDKKNISICVSVQIGCKFKCKICQTGKIGFKRNLFPYEILEQIKKIYILRVKPNRISCISIMGMGEPFDNLKNTMTAIEWISSNYGFKISRKKITISTSGCISFNNFFKYKKLPNLAISLHYVNENKRKYIFPSSKLSLKKLKNYMNKYCKITKKYISIEYCLIKDFNDKQQDILELINYLQDIPCKINLLNYNTIIGCDFIKVSNTTVDKIIYYIKKNNIPVIFRKSFGIKIGAGCGQLGNSFINMRNMKNAI